jgi:hypothetical protein
MDVMQEGQKVWVEMADGKAAAAVYVGEADQATWFGGVPRAYVVFPETGEGQAVELMRILPREDSEEA